MKKQILVCDICGKEVRDEKEWICLALIIDRVMDAAGSMDDVCRNVEICQACSADILKRLINYKLPESFNRDIRCAIANHIYDLVIRESQKSE